ncbi:MAG: HEAT repeat domain-containing protein [Candidatus Acidiferrales bacterium]
MVRRSRVLVGGCLAGLAACLFAVPLWSRLMVIEDQSMVDVRGQAENAPVVFRGRILTVQPDPIEKETVLWVDGKPVNTNFVAKFQVDRIYRGRLPGAAEVHFSYGPGMLAFNGHDCIDFRPNQNWLVFAVEKNGLLELFDDCTGALSISSRLGPKVRPSDWLAQMEADFIAGLEGPDAESRILSIQRLGGLKLPSSRPVLHEVIEKRKGVEAEWAVYATLRTGDVTVLPIVSRLLAGGDQHMPEWAIAHELRNVEDPSAVPELLEIFDKAPSDFTRLEVLIALVDNIKDRQVVPLLGTSLSSSDRQIRYLALSGLYTIANSEACSYASRYWNEDEETAFKRHTAKCKSWWDQEGKYRSWTRN